VEEEVEEEEEELILLVGANTRQGHDRSSPLHNPFTDLPSTRTWTTPATLDSEYAVVRAMQQEGGRSTEQGGRAVTLGREG
jgi:hypothetical protein